MAQKQKKQDMTAFVKEWVMRYTGVLGLWPEPDNDLIILQMEGIQRIPCLKRKDGSLVMISKGDLYEHFLRYADTLGKGQYMLNPNNARLVAQYWFATTPTVPFDDIPTFRFKSEPGLCWNRVDFDPEEGEFPTWEKLLSRIENVGAFVKFTGSIFFPDSYSQQYLVLWGAAGAGKGCYLRAMEKALGAGARAKAISPRKADKHYFEDVVGARLVTFDDFDDPTAFSCGLFKKWTGGGRIAIDPKGKAPFQAELRNKIVFTMNGVPQLKDTESDRRRAILCRIHAAKDPSEDFEDRLAEELPHFVYFAMTKLGDGRHLPIPTEKESFELTTSEDVVTHSYFWQKYFTIEIGAVTTAAEVHRRFQQEFPYATSDNKKGEYFRWLEESTEARRTRTTRGGDGKIRIIKNLKARHVAEDNPVTAEDTFYARENFLRAIAPPPHSPAPAGAAAQGEENEKD